MIIINTNTYICAKYYARVFDRRHLGTMTNSGDNSNGDNLIGNWGKNIPK